MILRGLAAGPAGPEAREGPCPCVRHLCYIYIRMITRTRTVQTRTCSPWYVGTSVQLLQLQHMLYSRCEVHASSTRSYR